MLEITSCRSFWHLAAKCTTFLTWQAFLIFAKLDKFSLFAKLCVNSSVEALSFSGFEILGTHTHVSKTKGSSPHTLQTQLGRFSSLLVSSTISCFGGRCTAWIVIRTFLRVNFGRTQFCRRIASSFFQLSARIKFGVKTEFYCATNITP